MKKKNSSFFYFLLFFNTDRRTKNQKQLVSKSPCILANDWVQKFRKNQTSITLKQISLSTDQKLLVLLLFQLPEATQNNFIIIDPPQTSRYPLV